MRKSANYRKMDKSDIILMVFANNSNNNENRYTYEILLLRVFLQVVMRSNFRPKQKYKIDFVLSLSMGNFNGDIRKKFI